MVEALLKKLMKTNLDEAPARRRNREAIKEIQQELDHCLLKIPLTGVKMKELYEVNSRGLEIFSKSWLPETSPIKAIVCFCHGFGDTCTFFFEGTAKKLASSGYGVFSMDYPGFGLSEGLHGYISNFDIVVDDIIEHFSKVKEHPEYKHLPSFLFGESMGGAVAMKVHLRQPRAWDGAILLAPMCKIAENLVPPWPLPQFLFYIAKLLPKKKLVPKNNLAGLAIKDPKKRELAAYNVIAYNSRLRLKTAAELLRTTQEIECQLEQISLPLLILHGDTDVITDPSASKALYEKSCSSDKKLRLYKDAYHAILEGESDEMVFQVLNDIISWLDERSTKDSGC